MIWEDVHCDICGKFLCVSTRFELDEIYCDEKCLKIKYEEEKNDSSKPFI